MRANVKQKAKNPLPKTVGWRIPSELESLLTKWRHQHPGTPWAWMLKQATIQYLKPIAGKEEQGLYEQ